MFYTGLPRDLQTAATWKLADDYIVLDAGKAPSAGMGIFGLVAGLLCIASFVRTMTLSKRIPVTTLNF
jgi:hypothetical protein